MTGSPAPTPPTGHGGARPGAGRKRGTGRNAVPPGESAPVGRPVKTDQADAYLILAKAKAKRETHRAQLAELEFKQRAGELVPAADVQRVWSAKVLTARSALLALPAKLAPELAPVTDPRRVAEIMREHIHAALSSLAGTPIEADAGRTIAIKQE